MRPSSRTPMLNHSLARGFYSVCVVLLSFVSSLATAQSSTSNEPPGQVLIQNLSDYHHDQLLKANAQIEIQLPKRMRDALKHEIPLTFETEFELNEKFNFLGINLNRNRTHILYKTKLYYFTYNQLYFITNLRNGRTQSFESLKEALNTLGTIDNFTITDLAELHPNTLYTLKLRLKFDPWELPSPLLIETLTSSDWHLFSGWHSVKIKSPSSWY